MSAFTPGLKLHDRYLLEQRIGVGGMAEVWQAHDLVLGRQVAIKVLAAAIAADPVLRAGAQREARAAAGLNHPNITAVHDYGEAVFPDRHVEPYLVMELLTGQTMADRLSHGPLPWPQVARIGAQIASALATAHAQGVVHRDIKPANIMLTQTGAKVLDFGIAALSGHADPSSGWLVGTPAYTAPERLHDSTPDPSADVYALGVLLAEAATGARPITIDSWQQAAQAHSGTRPELALTGLPAGAAALIRDCLDPTPARRPSAATIAHALSADQAAPDASPTLIAPMAGAPIAGSARVPSAPTRIYAPDGPPGPPARSRFSLAAVALMVVVGVVSVALILIAALRPSGDGNLADPSISPGTGGVEQSAQPSVEPSELGTDGAAVLIELRQAVNGGEIAQKRVRELRKSVNELLQRWERSRWDEVVNKAEDLRRKVDAFAEKGEISAQTADQLRGLLDQVIEAAGQQVQQADDDDDDD